MCMSIGIKVNKYVTQPPSSGNLTQMHLIAIISIHTPFLRPSNVVPLQLLLRPLPQLPCQLLVIGHLIVRPRHPHRHIIPAVRNFPLVRRRCPKLITRPLLRRHHIPQIRHIHEPLVKETQIPHQARVNDARMHRRRCDIRVAPCQFARV